MEDLLEFLCRLEAHRLSYTLAHNRDESIMVTIAVPGERWEVEFFADGAVEVEVFTSDGKDPRPRGAGRPVRQTRLGDARVRCRGASRP